MEIAVEKILKEKGIEYKLIRLSQKAYTVEDVILYSKGEVTPEEICKTIILKGKKTAKKYAVLLRGMDRVNFPAAKKVFREEMTIANSKEVKEAGGIEPGAVCPLLLNVPLYVDKRVLGLKRINCGSGDHLHELEFDLKDLSQAVNYLVVDLAKLVL